MRSAASREDMTPTRNRIGPPRVLVLAVAAGGCLWGCFEVHEVPVEAADPPRPRVLLIDDFEDGDPRPSASEVEPWRCATFDPGPGVQPVACGPAAQGNGSNGGYSLWFSLRDVPDGVNDFPVAELSAPLSTPLDVSGYQQFRFSARYEPGDVPLPAAAILQVSLHCNGADGSIHSLDNVAALPVAWQRIALPLANFAQPDWQPEHVDSAVCATHINELEFGITGFSDGQAASGTLMVDDVYFQ
jgi:hypothetical protein